MPDLSDDRSRPLQIIQAGRRLACSLIHSVGSFRSIRADRLERRRLECADSSRSPGPGGSRPSRPESPPRCPDRRPVPHRHEASRSTSEAGAWHDLPDRVQASSSTLARPVRAQDQFGARVHVCRRRASRAPSTMIRSVWSPARPVPSVCPSHTATTQRPHAADDGLEHGRRVDN